jgi:hypothetical protein
MSESGPLSERGDRFARSRSAERHCIALVGFRAQRQIGARRSSPPSLKRPSSTSIGRSSWRRPVDPRPLPSREEAFRDLEAETLEG